LATAKIAGYGGKPAQNELAGPILPPKGKTAVAPTIAVGSPQKPAVVIVSSQQPSLRQDVEKAALFGPRIPMAVVQMTLPPLPRIWPSSSLGIASHSPAARQTRVVIAHQKAQCWVVNLPKDGQLATVQRLLLLSGFDAGPIDGKNGLRTANAVQIAFGEAASRLKSGEVIARLQARLCADRPRP
jgi:peptidoglycan hydrolase-like protein with peptidoglycan-binding domain